MTEYEEFLWDKAQCGMNAGFDPVWMPTFLFDFQQSLVEWAIRKGRGAIFADCGMGKTPMQLVWAENVVRKTNGKVLLVTPLGVSAQTIGEGEKFGIEVRRSNDGTSHSGITVTNYERLHLFNPNDFTGCSCDESSAIKSFDGKRRAIVTDFMKKLEYRLLSTATAAPNDYIELGTSSEALGQLGYMDMLNRFFKNDNNTIDRKGHYKGFGAPRAYEQQKWRFKGHAEENFWRWVCSWARAIRKPSDLGFDDSRFVLPKLLEREHLVEAKTKAPGFLFDLPAQGLFEERQEQRRTLNERCERASALVNATTEPAVVWCHLNDEGDLLERLIPDATQISGSDEIDAKEEAFARFAGKQTRVLVIKPKIGAFGLNWQHCAHTTFFPSHSFEQYYQAIRRFWRFGQKRPVTVDIVTTESGSGVMANMQRKAQQADTMFASITKHMLNALMIDRQTYFKNSIEVPTWL